jgi:hypothetical protein
MKRLAKDYADKMVMDVLISLSKQNSLSSDFAQNSLDVMNNPVDNSIFTGVLLTKAKPSLFDDNEIDMKLTILSSLITVFKTYKKDEDFDFNNDLGLEISKLKDDDCSIKTKLDFALNQFVNAFYEYERLEKKYPELMKVM